MNIGDWSAFTSILDMQISTQPPCLICKWADFQTQPGKYMSEPVYGKFHEDYMNIGD